MQTSEMQKTFEKIFSVCEIIEFKLVALNIHLYGEREREKEKETGRQTDRETDKETDRERVLVFGSQYVNKQSQDFRYY